MILADVILWLKNTPSLLMIRDQWWREFLVRLHQGRQVHSYVRRGLAAPEKTSMILFYLTKPAGEMAGYAEFVERITGDTDELWNRYGQETVLNSKEKYEEFIMDKSKVSFIRFKNLHVAVNPRQLDNILMLVGKKRLSRYGFYVDKEIADKLIALMG
jgi:predicted transcriptional regulator